jgi:hypothetical protein
VEEEEDVKALEGQVREGLEEEVRKSSSLSTSQEQVSKEELRQASSYNTLGE